MTNLKLITTETFGDLSCNFYRNMNDDILLTREQIGIALEYSDPSKAIRKIHLKHKDRLDELCIRIRDKTIKDNQIDNRKDNLITEKIVYTLEGALVICSLSHQEKAFDFSQWLLNISNTNENIKVINSRNEIEFMKLLKDFLDEYKIKYIQQYKFENYRIDLYLTELKIAIEYDEEGHKYYPYESQEYREKYISQKLGCKFIRLNDNDSYGKNIAIVSKEII